VLRAGRRNPAGSFCVSEKGAVPLICPSNATVKQALVEAITFLSSNGYGIRLFLNNLAVGPGTLLSDFVEASYAGYARQGTSGIFSPIAKLQDGQYVAPAGPISFPASFGTEQTVYGFYIASLTQWYLAGTFSQPQVVTTLDPFVFNFSLIGQSLSVVC
jgi:hypothetical protein